MATYTKVPRTIPSRQRSTEITAVAAGDKLDFEEILGRPARGLQIFLTDNADEIQYRINNLARLKKIEETKTTTVENWMGGSAYPTYTGTGATTLEIVSDLKISSLEIVSLTLSVGTTVTIIVW